MGGVRCRIALAGRALRIWWILGRFGVDPRLFQVGRLLSNLEPIQLEISLGCLTRQSKKSRVFAPKSRAFAPKSAKTLDLGSKFQRTSKGFCTEIQGFCTKECKDPGFQSQCKNL